MPVGRVVVDLSWTNGTGSPGVNVWHARWADDFSDSDAMDGLIEALRLFYSDLNTLYPDGTDIAFNGEVTGVSTSTGQFATYASWLVEGIGGPSTLPPATQAVINWRASEGGRSGKGKTFIGPLASPVAQADGTLVTAVRGELEVAASNLIAASDGPFDGAWGVFSRQDNLLRDFVTATVPDKFAVLRSRRD